MSRAICRGYGVTAAEEAALRLFTENDVTAAITFLSIGDIYGGLRDGDDFSFLAFPADPVPRLGALAFSASGFARLTAFRCGGKRR